MRNHMNVQSSCFTHKRYVRLHRRQLVTSSQLNKMDTSAACIAIIIALENDNSTKKRKRKTWMKDWLRKRHKFTHDNLLKELCVSSPEDYENYLRMDHSTFLDLLNKVEPLIKKQDTIMRDCIPVSNRLSSTLRFLATGQSYEELKFVTAISPQSLGHIVMETCEALISVLKDYIKVGLRGNK